MENKLNLTIYRWTAEGVQTAWKRNKCFRFSKKNKGFHQCWSAIDRRNLLGKCNCQKQIDTNRNDLLYDVDALSLFPKHCIYDHNVLLKVVLRHAHNYAMIETVWRTIP